MIAGGAAQAQGWPANIKADYDIAFNGFGLGTFTFQAEAEDDSYTLTGSANLSMLLGAISWKSDVRTFGTLADKEPKPAAYAFQIQSGARGMTTRMGFEDGAVNSVAHMPPQPMKSDVVPVRAQHLVGVLDPLSAMMMIASSNNPCDRRIPVFDGRERFDLVFSRKGETKVSEQAPSGQPGFGHVCRVRYVPIAGHQPGDYTQKMAENKDIEVVLRPIPSAHVFVPYQVTIPTPLGTATLTSKRVEIMQTGKPRIALAH
ncbi:MAG: DUF3108 domain-containing protein [Hyphomicrobiaceae bacterium]|nr:DUF3108 domain-containing protein [Hyphomicrobiaceae bacterium]